MASDSAGLFRRDDFWLAIDRVEMVSQTTLPKQRRDDHLRPHRWSQTEQFTGTFKVMQKTMQHYYTKVNEATRIKAMPSILACSAEVRGAHMTTMGTT